MKSGKRKVEPQSLTASNRLVNAQCSSTKNPLEICPPPPLSHVPPSPHSRICVGRYCVHSSVGGGRCLSQHAPLVCKIAITLVS
jgi:hypothetical protein